MVTSCGLRSPARPVRIGIGAAALVLAFPAIAEQRPVLDDALSEITIPELETLYARRQVTVTEVTRWYLDRITRHDPAYGAYTKVMAERALKRAAALDAAGGPKGPLWGVPIAVKGSIAIEGEITAVGWWGYATPGKELRTRRSSTAVERLEAAGAIVIGQTNLPDLAATDTTVSTFGGRTGNAYNNLFSPGGSSGGSAVAVSANFAVAAIGTDGGNSIRNPAANAAIVGVLPSEGLVSNAGNHSGDWLKERTGPLARTVTDAAIMLEAMAGADPQDPLTLAAVPRAGPPLTAYLKPGSLAGKRFGVPKFILDGTPVGHPDAKYWNRGTSPETRAMFMQAVAELRAAGATVVFDDDLLPEAFSDASGRIRTTRYLREGVDRFLSNYGPVLYRSTDEFEAVTGIKYPEGFPMDRFVLASDPEAEAKYHAPKREALAMYRAAMSRFRLDGFVYPALQVPSNPERVPLPADYPSEGPYSATWWANRIGVPAVVVPAGFYRSGLPFGLEFSGDRGGDGMLLGFAYDYEQRTRHRHPPVLASTAATSQ